MPFPDVKCLQNLAVFHYGTFPHMHLNYLSPQLVKSSQNWVSSSDFTDINAFVVFSVIEDFSKRPECHKGLGFGFRLRFMVKNKVKNKQCIAVSINLAFTATGNSHAIWDHTVLLATWQ